MTLENHSFKLPLSKQFDPAMRRGFFRRKKPPKSSDSKCQTVRSGDGNVHHWQEKHVLPKILGGQIPKNDPS